jgi:phosphatidate cytidylyltransferase
MGTVLVILTLAVLLVDQRFAPAYPFLFILVMTLGGLACRELLHLLAGPGRPPAALCFCSVLALLGANWAPALGFMRRLDADPWHWIVWIFAAIVTASFLVEMATFREAGESIVRIALGIWIAAYLGLLPSFFAQLRWLGARESASGADAGTLALVLAVFVPKCGDIGAYFTGRVLGRHPMAPVLSPKKTWEGAAGGIVASVAAAVSINRLGPLLATGWQEVGFGLTVGAAGMLGDLAESLIKRDCKRKDASLVVPGFGGVLDVIDAVIFAAPVAYWWLR